MADDPRRKALKKAGRAQTQFEKSRQRLDDHIAARRESFREAAAAGASMAEIAEAVGLNRSRVNQIIHGK